eukprot:223752-Rhodomonas_salina.1
MERQCLRALPRRNYLDSRAGQNTAMDGPYAGQLGGVVRCDERDLGMGHHGFATASRQLLSAGRTYPARG